MKEKILNTSRDMFLNLGFKSVTMDDIAKEIGISKKTIYSHFVNKTGLIDEVTDSIFCTVSEGIELICKQKKNPIIELFEIKNLVMFHLKDEKSSPQYQLQKYYPSIYAKMTQKKFSFMQKTIVANLQRGVKTKVFRSNINVSFIFRLYFNGMIGIQDKKLFPLQIFSTKELTDYYIEYHLRGVCTQKGIEILEKELKN